jgi:hypothetical protein
VESVVGAVDGAVVALAVVVVESALVATDVSEVDVDGA